MALRSILRMAKLPVNPGEVMAEATGANAVQRFWRDPRDHDVKRKVQVHVEEPHARKHQVLAGIELHHDIPKKVPLVDWAELGRAFGFWKQVELAPVTTEDVRQAAEVGNKTLQAKLPKVPECHPNHGDVLNEWRQAIDHVSAQTSAEATELAVNPEEVMVEAPAAKPERFTCWRDPREHDVNGIPKIEAA
jgi:hypothetical protein